MHGFFQTAGGTTRSGRRFASAAMSLPRTSLAKALVGIK
jgi:hypothetical protein